MSNKSNLQENNLDLQQILQAVQNLPNSNIWSGGGVQSYQALKIS